MTRPSVKYNFKVKFICQNPKCKQEARLVQYVRCWSFVETFHTDDASIVAKELYKPEIVHFRCSVCNETVLDHADQPVEGRKRMYNWLFDHGMLRVESGSVVNSLPYKFKSDELEKREIAQEASDELCNPALLP